MLKNFVNAWDKNKGELENYFRTHPLSDYYFNYTNLVKLLFDMVINPEMEYEFDRYRTGDDEIHVIDDGDYQGTYIFLLHKDTYQPGVSDYIYTSVWYGSCSGCDTLQSICSYADDTDFATEEQIEGYMELCLHLLQNCNYICTYLD